MAKRLYVASFGFPDMAIAAVAKDSPAAPDFRRLRSRIEVPPVEAAPRVLTLIDEP